MKKIILAIVAATLIVKIVSAQVESEIEPLDLRNQVTFGLKAGINFSTIYDSKDEEFESEAKMGFAGGAFLAIPLGTYLGIQPEVLYSRKGFKSTGSTLGSEYEFTRRTNWLDVPLLVAIKPSSTLTILGGPQFSWLIDEEYDFDNELISGEVGREFENDDLRDNILGLTGGIDLTLGNVVISGRIGWDLKENNQGEASTTPRYKNTWLQFTFGFRF